MLAVKLDHAQTQVPSMRASQTDIGAVDTWLSNMDAAAARAGIWKQYVSMNPATDSPVFGKRAVPERDTVRATSSRMPNFVLMCACNSKIC